MKKVFFIFLCVLLLAGCGVGEKTNADDLFSISAELLNILWNVDYTTFTCERTTEFARTYYEEGYFLYYMEEEEYNAGVSYAQDTELVSRLIDTEDLGTEDQTLDSQEYSVQTIRVHVCVDHFRPEDPDTNFFEEGQTYTLVYNIYFIREDGEPKIAGFSYSPEGEEMLPASEKEPLSQAERAKIMQITKEYLEIRYDFDVHTFSAEEAWVFYSENLTEEFLERDEISLETIREMLAEYTQYEVFINLVDSILESGEQKTYVYDGVNQNFYYWVKAVYTYSISAREEYLVKKDIGERGTLTEILYFEKQTDGDFKMAWAKYGTE